MSQSKIIYLNSEELGYVFTLGREETQQGLIFSLDHRPLLLKPVEELQKFRQYRQIQQKGKRSEIEAALIWALRETDIWKRSTRKIQGITFGVLEELLVELFRNHRKIPDEACFYLSTVQKLREEEDSSTEVLAADSESETFSEILSYAGQHFNVSDNWHPYFQALLK
jgi:hypothetical protein